MSALRRYEPLRRCARPVGNPDGGVPPSRAERNKREKQERIRRAARKLFARKGFERTTTREIAEAADVGAGTLFLYAGSKEDLLVSIFREDVDRVVRTALATMPPGPLLERVLHVFGSLIAYHEQDRGLARAFVKELPFVADRRHGMAETMSRLLDGIADLAERARVRGEVMPEVPPRLLARNLFALYLAQLQRWLGGDPLGAQERDAELRAALELQLAGLANRRPDAARREPPAPALRAVAARAAKRGGRGGP